MSFSVRSIKPPFWYKPTPVGRIFTISLYIVASQCTFLECKLENKYCLLVLRQKDYHRVRWGKVLERDLFYQKQLMHTFVLFLFLQKKLQVKHVQNLKQDNSVINRCLKIILSLTLTSRPTVVIGNNIRKYYILLYQIAGVISPQSKYLLQYHVKC